MLNAELTRQILKQKAANIHCESTQKRSLKVQYPKTKMNARPSISRNNRDVPPIDVGRNSSSWAYCKSPLAHSSS